MIKVFESFEGPLLTFLDCLACRRRLLAHYAPAKKGNSFYQNE